MARRSQIDRLSRTVERVALALKPTGVSYVPLYGDETVADAVAAYREEFGIEPNPARLIVNRARPGDTREACKANGIHDLFCLGPNDIRQVLAAVDGVTRGIPAIAENLTGEKRTTR